MDVTLQQIRQWEARLREVGSTSTETETLMERIDAGYAALGMPGQDWHNFWPAYRPRKTPENPLVKTDLRADVWDKTGGKCWYCGMQTNPWRDFCIDHFIAKTAGGPDELDNLVPCCRPCNNKKGNRPLHRFRQLMSEGQSPLFTAEQREYLTAHGIMLPEPVASYVFYFERIEGQAGE